MLYRQGLRVSEAVGLRRDEVDMDQARVWERRLKDGLCVDKQPIAGNERRAIKHYLASRSDARAWLLLSERGQPLSPRTVNYILAAAAAPEAHRSLHANGSKPVRGTLAMSAPVGHDISGLIQWCGRNEWRPRADGVMAEHFTSAMEAFDLEFAQIHNTLGGNWGRTLWVALSRTFWSGDLDPVPKTPSRRSICVAAAGKNACSHAATWLRCKPRS